MPETIKILLIAAGRRVSLSERFIAAGKNLDKNIEIFSYEMSEDVPIAFNSELIIGKEWADSKIGEHILEIINEKNINIVLPFMDQVTIILSELKETSKQNDETLILVSESNLCKILFDKKLANDWFKNINLSTPDSENGDYPKIIKKRDGFGARGLFKASNDEEFSVFFQNKNKDDYIIQKFINGKEYTVDSYVANDGNIICAIPRIRLEVRSGEVATAITDKNESIIELSEKILKSGKFKGPVCLQFIEEESTGKIYIVEINPRFGGGVINSIEAGANMPEYVIKEYLNEEISPPEEIQWNLKMLRADREFFICK